MQFRNRTKWKTADLTRIVRKVARLEELTPEQLKRLTVEIVYGRNDVGSSGFCRTWTTREGKPYAYLVRVRVRSRPFCDLSLIEFARITAHEFAHVRGMRGERKMRSSARYGRPKDPEMSQRSWDMYSWVLSIPVRLEKQTKTRARKSPPKERTSLSSVVSLIDHNSALPK